MLLDSQNGYLLKMPDMLRRSPGLVLRAGQLSKSRQSRPLFVTHFHIIIALCIEVEKRPL